MDSTQSTSTWSEKNAIQMRRRNILYVRGKQASQPTTIDTRVAAETPNMLARKTKTTDEPRKLSTHVTELGLSEAAPLLRKIGPHTHCRWLRQPPRSAAARWSRPETALRSPGTQHKDEGREHETRQNSTHVNVEPADSRVIVSAIHQHQKVARQAQAGQISQKRRHQQLGTTSKKSTANALK